MTGILEKLISQIEEVVYDNNGIVKPIFLTNFIRELQYNEYDAHIVIMGQNGSGKSMLMLALMKLLDTNSIKEGRIVYAYDSTKKLIKILKESQNACIGIDEGKKFFHYKRGMETEQVVLMNMIEYARENRNAFIVCSNDIRRLNNNYRNSKVQVVVWLIDRYDKENQKMKSYGLVFVGNPALEEEDKFNMNSFTGLYTFEQIRIVAESNPTFYGYLFLEDIKNIVSEEEIKIYQEQKKKGIQETADKYMQKLDKKEKSENSENKEDITQILKYDFNAINKFKSRNEHL